MRGLAPFIAASLASLLLAGCVPSSPPEPVQPPDGAMDRCGWGRLGAYLGRLPTDDVMARIRSEAGHDRIRTIRPGDAVTMDFSPDRLNVEIGEDGRIRRFRCG